MTPTGEIAWTAERVTDSHGDVYSYTYLWRISNRVFSKLHSTGEGPNIIVELDPETGAVIAKDL
jgi:hypothetical protein